MWNIESSQYSMIRFSISLTVFASLCACSDTLPNGSCVDPFIEQFKCDTELPCNDIVAPSNTSEVIAGWEQEFEF